VVIFAARSRTFGLSIWIVTWELAAALAPAAPSILAISRATAESPEGTSASIRSAMSSALASSAASRSGRAIDSAWLTVISPPSYDRSIGQYGSGALSSTHQARFRSSISSRSVIPNAAAVSDRLTTFLLTT
jgi:hypothetical protein